MPLRTAPLPRMAGDLTFMRSRRATIADLQPGQIAVLGAPLEAQDAPRSGCRFAPRAIRETSVYFGWQANPQFAGPVEIDHRERSIDTRSMHEQLVDIGDVATGGCSRSEAERRIANVVSEARSRGASLIVLGGDASCVQPVLQAAETDGAVAGVVRVGSGPATCFMDPDRRIVWNVCSGGPVPVETTVPVCVGERRQIPLTCARKFTSRDWARQAQNLAAGLSSLHVHLDTGAVASHWHGMSTTPRFNGFDLQELRVLLSGLGRAPVATLSVTGLEPLANGIGRIKTGQRLLVTAMLGYIYARLGLLEGD